VVTGQSTSLHAPLPRQRCSLLAIVALLAVSNLGTSFAAAYLAKDTSTSENFELTDRKTKEALSTQTTTDSISFERTTITPDGRRHLCSRDTDPDGNKVLNCDVDSSLTVSERDCSKMIRMCHQGNSVSLTREWSNGEQNIVAICPANRAKFTRSGTSRILTADGELIAIERTDGNHCSIRGGAIEQQEFEICEVDGDCAPGLACTQLESFVEECQFRCAMKRWAPRLVTQCQTACVHPSCHSVPLSRSESWGD